MGIDTVDRGTSDTVLHLHRGAIGFLVTVRIKGVRDVARPSRIGVAHSLYTLTVLPHRQHAFARELALTHALGHSKVPEEREHVKREPKRDGPLYDRCRGK